MPPESEGKGGRAIDDIIWKAVLAAIVIGIIITLILVMAIREESYSALYLKPDSYSNYVEDNEVSFIYGVQCFENEETRYRLSVFLGENLITEKDFTLVGRGEELEDNITFDLPKDVEFPVKVSLLLIANNQNYSTHFWLKGRE